MLIYRAGSWWSAGGTSLAAPILTSLYALAGNHTAPMSAYQDPAGLVDVTSGTSGSCTPSVLCDAGRGWDGPTGLGTPAGLGALVADGYVVGTSVRLSGGTGYPARLRAKLIDDRTGAGISGARLELQRRLGSGAYVTLRKATTAADGTVSFTDRPTAMATYRVLYGGTVDRSPAVSDTVWTGRLPLRFTTRASGTRLSTTVRAPWGAQVTAVTIELQEREGRRGVSKRVVRTNARGVASVTVARAGTYRWTYAGGGSWRSGHAAAVRVR
jgi:hypothetical protein